MIIPAHGDNFVYPYNPIYNYNKNKSSNCLVLMFISFESDGNIYPVIFDYWISKVYYEDGEKYLTKNDVFIKAIDYLVSQGLNVDNMLMDAGFLNKQVLEKLSELELTAITRCPRSRILEFHECKVKAKELFSESYNGDFYYYHKFKKFLNSEVVKIGDQIGRLVAAANNRDSLLSKELFFLFSTNTNLTAPKILSLYKLRWKIESLFKVLKSYLGLSVFYRNNYDYVEERINLALSGFFVIQEMSNEIKLSFYQTLKLLKSGELQELYEKSFKSTSKYFIYCV